MDEMQYFTPWQMPPPVRRSSSALASLPAFMLSTSALISSTASTSSGFLELKHILSAALGWSVQWDGSAVSTRTAAVRTYPIAALQYGGFS